MQATCSHCGARFVLRDEAMAGYAKVQFRCSKCGRSTVVDRSRKPGKTLVVTPLPEFARSRGRSGDATGMIAGYQGLALPADRQITLAVVAGPAKGLVCPLEKPRVVLGRDGADISIDDPEVSRRHCAVEVQNEIVRVRDLDSTNGTYVREERVRAAELGPEAEFRIGATVVRVSIRSK
jgi:predicted Zn finger-like uncharacterized protein